jgi:uncharacterized membrane protein
MRSKWFPLIILAVMLAFSAAAYPQLPDIIPTHWNVTGEADGFSPKLQGVLLLPFIVGMVLVMRFTTRRIDPRRDSYSQFEGTFYLFINATALFMGLMHIMSLGAALGWEISITRVALAGTGLLLAILGNEMRRIQPNWFIGIRTPWTLSDEVVWRETHAFGGRLMFVVGMVTLITGLVLPTTITVGLMLAALLAMTVWTYYFSYRRFQMRQTR